MHADEIDSIGKARLDGDQSSSEQQNGLLQLLYEMDSYSREDKVLYFWHLYRKFLSSPVGRVQIGRKQLQLPLSE